MRYHFFTILFFTSFFFIGCSSSDSQVNHGFFTSQEQNGIVIDSITLDYARIKTSPDGFHVLEKISSPSSESNENTLIYFDFLSKSREETEAYYQQIQNEYLKEGIAIDFSYPYKDSLEDISIRIKINNNDFEPLDETEHPIILIPVPDINCECTFAKYEMSRTEYSTLQQSRFPDHLAIGLKNKLNPAGIYQFEVTFVFNKKTITLTSIPLKTTM